MKYYTLAYIEDGRWVAGFGDYSRKIVEQERYDCYVGIKTKIIVTPEDNVCIIEKINNMNIIRKV